MSKQLQITISVEEFESLDALAPHDRELMLHAQEATSTAYAPYSNFLVGTALLLSNGQVMIGTNQEAAAYPSGLCAERTALFAKGAQLPAIDIEAMAVTARKRGATNYLPVTSCGACRQVMAEFEQRQNRPIRIIFPADGGKFHVCRSVSDLLPLQFNSKSLDA